MQAATALSHIQRSVQPFYNRLERANLLDMHMVFSCACLAEFAFTQSMLEMPFDWWQLWWAETATVFAFYALWLLHEKRHELRFAVNDRALMGLSLFYGMTYVLQLMEQPVDSRRVALVVAANKAVYSLVFTVGLQMYAYSRGEVRFLRPTIMNTLPVVTAAAGVRRFSTGCVLALDADVARLQFNDQRFVVAAIIITSVYYVSCLNNYIIHRQSARDEARFLCVVFVTALLFMGIWTSGLVDQTNKNNWHDVGLAIWQSLFITLLHFALTFAILYAAIEEKSVESKPKRVVASAATKRAKKTRSA